MLRRFAAISVVLVMASGPAYAQTRSEPFDVDVAGDGDRVGTAVPFRASDGPFAERTFDDRSWRLRPVPDVRSDGDTPQVGWYRFHVRVGGRAPREMAVQLPPIYGAWQLFWDGKLLRTGGADGVEVEPADEQWQIVTLSGAEPGSDHVLALRVVAWEGMHGIAGAPVFGPRPPLELRLERRRVIAFGITAAFFVFAVLALSQRLLNRGDRIAGVMGLMLLLGALYGAANNDFWYFALPSTEAKLRLRALTLWALQIVALPLADRLFGHRAGWFGRGVQAASAMLAVCALLAPMAWVIRLHAASWVITAAGIGYALLSGLSLPKTAPASRLGVRAVLLGLLVAVLYEAGSGTWRLPGQSAFELVFLVLAGSVGGVVAVRQSMSRARATRVLLASRDGIAVMSRRNEVVLASPALEAMLGVRADRLEREGLDGFIAESSKPAFAALVGHLALDDRPARTERAEIELSPPLGERVHAEVLGAVLDEENLLLAFRDVGEQRKLQDEVARAQRLDSLGMLAGGIAHDFNNLLAGILLTATELERESSPGSEQAEKIAHIVESARRGASLTQRLLQFARGRVRPSQGVDLGEELPDLLDMLSRTLGRNLDWQVDIEPDLPPVPLDEGELEQVLVNLCVNARDAMAPRGGRISVRAGLGKDGRVFLQVQDNGPGIPAHLLPRVFEPFVTTKGSSTGTGLGLAVVYGIAKGRGGEARVESPPGEGATVTLLLPALTAPAAESAPPERTDEPAPSGLRVLLVDDEPVLRTGLARALRHRGFDVLALEDGEAAVAWMEQQPDGAAPVDAVVMDMVMPGLDGVAAASALRSRWPGLPVVISSGYTGKEGIEPLLPTGPTLLLEKPYQPDDLLRAIGRVASA